MYQCLEMLLQRKFRLVNPVEKLAFLGLTFYIPFKILKNIQAMVINVGVLLAREKNS